MSIELQTHRPLREVVYDELKIKIMTGEITPGTRMMEVELAEQMGVSRTPVREAIRKLEKEGLVSILPRRGAYASDVSLSDMANLFLVRENLEALAAELAAQNADEDDIKKLEKLTKAYAKAVNSGDAEAIIEQDEKYHKAIAEATGNKALIQVSSEIQELALRFRYMYYDNFSEYKNMPEEHNNIVEAIKAGDAETARALAKDHVGQLRTFLIQENEKGFSLK